MCAQNAVIKNFVFYIYTFQIKQNFCISYIYIPDETGYCPPYPQPFNETLDPGCTYLGANFLDVGACLGGKCPASSVDDGSCDKTVTSSCGVTSYDIVYVDCADSSIKEYELITSCGCIGYT